LLNGYILFT
jgi:hypothetical protein